MAGKESVRSCLACRKRAPKGELVRVVLKAGRLEWDRRQREPGRGAYLHPRAECLLRGDLRLWGQALKVSGGEISEGGLQELRASLLGAFLKTGAQVEGQSGARKTGGRSEKRLRL
jgi:predicted RNA-binding protein YlxR (DUF448 family)